MFYRWLFVLLYFSSFGHCVVCPSFDLRLLIALWYLLAIVLSVLPLIYGFWLPFGIFWPLCCLSYLWFTASDCPLVSFGHCVVCPSFDLRLLIVLWYLLAIVLSVLPLIYGFWLPFGIFWPLCCLSFLWFTASDCPLVSAICPFFYCSPGSRNVLLLDTFPAYNRSTGLPWFKKIEIQLNGLWIHPLFSMGFQYVA
jgi:hypothetical protein